MRFPVPVAILLLAITQSRATAEPAPEISLSDGPAVTEERVDTNVSTLAGPDSADEPELPEGGASYTPPDTRPRKPYELHLRASVSGIYDDNVFIQEKNPVSDFITGVSAGATLGLGDVEKQKDAYVTASYDISPYFYLKESSLNNIDQSAALRGQWHGAKLTIGSVFRFLDSTGGDKDAGARVNQKVYDGDLTATYVYSDKTRLGAELRARLSDYVQQIDTTETSVTAWAEYQVTPLISSGAGLTLGHVDVEKSGAQTYEQIALRANYALATKVNVVLNAGYEFRQVEGADGSATPVFSLEADYSPYELLKLTLEGYRRVLPSIVSRHENTDVTGVSLRASERFLTSFEATLTGGFEHTDYQSESSDVAVNRTENYVIARAGLAYILSAQWRIEGFYELRSNTSTENDRSFDAHRTGVNLSFNF